MTVHQIILNWLKNHITVFQFREEGSTFYLKELASGKNFTINTKEIVQHRLTENPMAGDNYLNLVNDAGIEFVLCHAGLAFSPSFENTGPLADAPNAICMMDYYQMYNHLIDLSQNPDLRNQALLLFQVLIATLDGAKKVGLDVALEEEQLDATLTKFEKQF